MMNTEPKTQAPLKSRVSRRDFFGRFSAAAGYAVTGGVALAAELAGDEQHRQPIQVTVLGMGHRGLALAEAVRQTPGLELAGWHDPCEDAARLARTRFGGDAGPAGPRTFTDETEAIESPLTDAVLVATPSDLHNRQILKAIAARKHVLTEKPAGIDRIELNRLESALCPEYPGVFFVGFQRRYHAGRNRLIAWLGEGHLGPLIDIRVDWTQPQGPPRGRGGWMTDPARTGDWVAEHGDHVWDLLNQLRPGAEMPIVLQATRLRGRGGDSAYFKANLAWADGVSADIRHSFLPGGHFASPGLNVYAQYRSGVADLIHGRVNGARKFEPPEPFDAGVPEDAAMLRAFAAQVNSGAAGTEENRAANCEQMRKLAFVNALREAVVSAFES